MTYIYITAAPAMTIEGFRAVAAKHDAPRDIEGLLAWTAGTDANGLHVVTMWESKAHADRFEAQQLFPAFQAVGLVSTATEDSSHTTFDADEFYIRPE